MNRRIAAPIAVAVCVVAASVSGESGDAAAVRLFSARTLRCSFGEGRSISLDTDPPGYRATEFGGQDQCTFDSINLRGKSARIIGTVGAGDVRLIQTDNAITFIDSTNATVSTYTVFASYVPGSEHFAAALSEHWMLGGKAAAIVYSGRCRALQ